MGKHFRLNDVKIQKTFAYPHGRAKVKLKLLTSKRRWETKQQQAKSFPYACVPVRLQHERNTIRKATAKPFLTSLFYQSCNLGGTRTHDLDIKNAPLCQLSYQTTMTIASVIGKTFLAKST